MDAEHAKQLLATERERIENDLAAAKRGGPEESDERREPGDYDSEGLYQDELDAGIAEDLKGRRAGSAEERGGAAGGGQGDESPPRSRTQRAPGRRGGADPRRAPGGQPDR